MIKLAYTAMVTVFANLFRRYNISLYEREVMEPV